jgi:hypothetical protein
VGGSGSLPAQAARTWPPEESGTVQDGFHRSYGWRSTGSASGLIQSRPQATLRGLSAWVEVGGIAPPCAQKRLCRKRSRTDQRSAVDPRCAHAARGSVSSLVSAVGGRARNPGWMPELGGSGALLFRRRLRRCRPPPRHSQRARWAWSCGGRRRIPRSATSSSRWSQRRCAPRSVTERSARSPVARRISISWCMTAGA